MFENLIDASGRVAYKSKSGPFGFNPDDLQASVAQNFAGCEVAKMK